MISLTDFLAFAGLIVVWQFGEQIARWSIRVMALKAISGEVEKFGQKIRNNRPDGKEK